jgi:hypothetical protein
MPTTTSHTATRQGMAPELLMAIWQTLREQLEAKQNQIYDDIANYPPPIPACDQHFNYLLEQRTGIAQELRQQKTLAEESLKRGDPAALIREFIASSVYVNDATKQNVLARLANP